MKRSAGPLATRGMLYTAMGPWATGTAQVFLNDSAGTDGGAAGTAVFAKGGTGALAGALEQAAASLGVQIRTGAEVVAIRSAARVRSASRSPTASELDAPVIVSAADPKRTAAALRPRDARADDGVADRQHPPARRDGDASTSRCRGCPRSTVGTPRPLRGAS